VSRIIHFELPVDQPERAIKFYETVFGWRIEKWNGPVNYWLVSTGESSEPGIDGAIMQRGGAFASAVNTLAVASLDEAMQAVVANGGSIVVPRMAIPGVGYMAYFADTEGNLSGLMQSDPTA
jgi:predicted enzyme related to lactoylglutathione lyase